MAVITASPKNFAAMLDMQATANEHLFTMRKLLENAQLTQIATLVETKQIDDDGDRLEKLENDTLEIEKETLQVQKEALALAKEQAKVRAEEAEAIARIAEGVKTFKTIGDRISDLKKSFSQNFGSLSALKTTFMKSMNVGGIFNKSIEKEKFIQGQKAIDPSKSRAELAENFKAAQATSKLIKKNEEEIEKFKKLTGLGDSDIAKTIKGKELLAKREDLSAEYSKVDVRSQFVKQEQNAPMTALTPAPIIQQTPTEAFASAGEAQEMAQEQAKAVGEQTTLLTKIEENTRGGGTEQKSSEASGGGGILAGIGAGLKGLGMGLKGLGQGAGKGIQALLMGLARGVMALANPMALVGLGALTLAAMGLGKALEFAAPAIEAFAPVLMKVVEVIGDIFIKAIEAIPEVIKSVGDVIIGVVTAISDAITGIIDAVVTSIERLAAIDGSNLLSVGAGLLAIAGGMAAFGAGSAVAGVGNLVGGLLGAITPGGSPVDQIMKLGKEGPNIEKAGIGVEKLAAGLTAFSGINTEKIKAIAALPTEKIAAMGAAMGNAGTVESKSAQNRALDAQAGAGGGNTAVVAPTVNNVTRKTELIKPPIRNQESSVNRWLATKYH